MRAKMVQRTHTMDARSTERVNVVHFLLALVAAWSKAYGASKWSRHIPRFRCASRREIHRSLTISLFIPKVVSVTAKWWYPTEVHCSLAMRA